MSLELSQRVQKITESPTLAITSKAKALKAAGEDVLIFAAGEPDFPVPMHILEAGNQAVLAGQTKYTAVEGTAELKDAIRAKLLRDNHLKYERSEILVSNGGKHSLYNIAQALFDEGDEVIVPAPYWVSYPDQILLQGARPVILETSDKTQFRISPEQLEKAITKKTKAFILNSPSNPTGSAYGCKDLQCLADICLKNKMWIISDEIYEKIVYDGFEHVSVASLSSEIKNITLTVNGASKVYAMTGLRMGFTAGPQEIIAAMAKIQGQSTSNISTWTQAACVAAFNGPQDFLKDWVREFKVRRDLLVAGLNAISGISCLRPEGAFYVFPNVTGILGKKTASGKIIQSSDDFANWLLDEYRVAVVSGEGFGAPGYVRLSYACSQKELERGLERIAVAVRSLS